MTSDSLWGHWMYTFDKKMARLRAAGSPPTAYETLVQRVRDLPCRALSEFLPTAEHIPSRSLEEFLSEGGDRPMRRTDNCITYPYESAPICVAISLAREEAAVRARWAPLRAAWVGAVLRAPRPALGAVAGC